MMSAELQSLRIRKWRRNHQRWRQNAVPRPGNPTRADVASFGQKLRQAREARNITLQEIAATTKIGTRALQALEWERFEQLPGGIFNKGFVRAYARAVGLNEDETVAAYLEAAKVAPPETDMHTLATQVEAARPERRGGGPNAATVVGVVAVLVALVLGGLWLREHRKESREQAEAQQSRAASSVAPTPVAQPPVVVPAQSTAAVTPTPDATPAAPPPTAPAPSAPVEVSISATARSWISVISDDNPAETVTLDPAKPELTTRTYKAKERVRLIVGNPAGIAVTCNGKPAGELGKAGQRVTLLFTSEGMQKQ
jgi:cytoskeletal protein RodZ